MLPVHFAAIRRTVLPSDSIGKLPARIRLTRYPGARMRRSLPWCAAAMTWPALPC